MRFVRCPCLLGAERGLVLDCDHDVVPKSGRRPDTDFGGGDLLPEKQKFATPTAAACCGACLNYTVDKFCQAWSWRSKDEGDGQ